MVEVWTMEGASIAYVRMMEGASIVYAWGRDKFKHKKVESQKRLNCLRDLFTSWKKK